MSPKVKNMVVAFTFVVMIFDGVRAQSTCINAFMTLGPCYGFVTGSSSVPSASCCSQFDLLIQTQPECLCAVIISAGAVFGIIATQTFAITVPSACSLQNPSVSQCNVESGQRASVTSPASAPVGSQSSHSSLSDKASNAPSAGTGSKTVPSTNNISSCATITKSSFHVAIFLLLTVSLALTASRF